MSYREERIMALEICREDQRDVVDEYAQRFEDDEVTLEQWESIRKMAEHRIRVCNGALRKLRQ